MFKLLEQVVQKTKTKNKYNNKLSSISIYPSIYLSILSIFSLTIYPSNLFSDPPLHQAMTAGDDMSTISSSSQDLTTTRELDVYSLSSFFGSISITGLFPQIILHFLFCPVIPAARFAAYKK